MTGTELALIAADRLVVNDSPAWQDPIIRDYRDRAIMPFFQAINRHALDEKTVDPAIHGALEAYDRWVLEIEQGLPEGYLQAHVSPYDDVLRDFRNLLDEQETLPLSKEELDSFLSNADMLNNMLPETE